MHGMSLEELSALRNAIDEYFAKFYGFDRNAKARRTTEWVAGASRRLKGETVCCCECGEDYPSADLQFRDEIYCEKCRIIEAERAAKKEG